MRRPALVTAVVAGILLVPATASAHPALNPSELPPGETVESSLVVPHGCAPGGGMPDTDGSDTQPTVELAVQHTDDVTLEPMDVAGWEVTDDGEAWVWNDAGGATTEVIEFPVMLTIDADIATGEALYLRAYQECADGSSFQWVGTPDEGASFPAIKLAASDGAVGTAEPDEGANMDHGNMDTGEQDGDMDTGADEELATDEDATGDEDDVAAGAGEAANDDGGLSTPLLVLLAVLVVAAVAGLVVRGRAS